MPGSVIDNLRGNPFRRGMRSMPYPDQRGLNGRPVLPGRPNPDGGDGIIGRLPPAGAEMVPGGHVPAMPMTPHGLGAVDGVAGDDDEPAASGCRADHPRSEEHTSELQSREKLVCRLL